MFMILASCPQYNHNCVQVTVTLNTHNTVMMMVMTKTIEHRHNNTHFNVIFKVLSQA
jgi:hypothetical protein